MLVSIQKKSVAHNEAHSKPAPSHDLNTNFVSAASTLNLLETLQSTLELKELLQLFKLHISEIVTIDGIHYREDSRSLDHQLGKQSIHSCGYRLLYSNENYGEIVFKRDSRFKESELEIIESQLFSLLSPIANALEYLDALHNVSTASSLLIQDQSTVEDLLGREIGLAKRHNHAFSILRITLENPQRINKDDSVNFLARIVNKVCRETDLLLRTRENELLLMMNKSNSVGVNKLCFRLKSTFNSNQNEESGENFKLKLGSATLTGTDSVSSLIQRAEKSLGKTGA